MHRYLVILSSIYFLLSANSFAQEVPEYLSENTSSFTLTIDGINEVKGEVRIAVFNSKTTYTKDPIYAVVLKIDKIGMEWEVPDLPFGDYAIAVHHDKNENGKLDKNILGIPKEDYGFSNNARGKFGPATWMDAKFTINKILTTHTIKIK